MLMMMMMMMCVWLWICNLFPFFRIKMLGSMTLTMMKNAEVVAPTKRQSSVMFKDESGHFDPQQCRSEKEFTVKPNHEYVLLTHNEIFSAIVGKTTPIPRGMPKRHLGYSISLKHLDMIVTVGNKTPLSLLLQSGYFYVVPFFMTLNQFAILAQQSKENSN